MTRDILSTVPNSLTVPTSNDNKMLTKSVYLILRISFKKYLQINNACKYHKPYAGFRIEKLKSLEEYPCKTTENIVQYVFHKTLITIYGTNRFSNALSLLFSGSLVKYPEMKIKHGI